MLHFFIKVLEKVLVGLKNIEERNISEMSESKNYQTSGIFSKIILWLLAIMPIGLLGLILFMIPADLMDFSAWFSIVYIFISGIIFVKIFMNIARNFTKTYLHLVVVPGLVALSVTLFGFFGIISNQFNFNEIPHYLVLVGIFPLMYILSEKHYKFTERYWFVRLRGIFFNYNLFLYFILSIYVTLAIFGVQIPFLHEVGFVLSEIFNINGSFHYYSFLEYIFTLGIIFFTHFFVIYFPLAGLHTYFDVEAHPKKSFAKGWLIFIIMYLTFYLIYFIPEFKFNYFSDYINKTHQIVHSEGFNHENLKERNSFILERAFLSDIKYGSFSQKDRELFQKIFDTTPEEFYGEEVADYFNNSRIFATNISKTGENADVIFELAEIQNKINSEEKILETSYEFYFENTTQTSQEVIINFEAPSHNSVVSELYLGLNDELVGQIAPRGAARRVYEDSLRRNTDPALIEKIGFSSYNLRIFPIPSKNIKQGKQKVLVKMLTPLDNVELKISPKFSLINLKFDKNSRYISKTYKDEELSNEEILEGKKDILEKISKDTYQNFGDIQLSEVPQNSVCLAQDFQNILENQNISLENKKELGKQIHIFFDNSKSIENNSAQKYYNDIYQAIKNYDNSLQDTKLYSFNFMVERQVKIQDIDFWGYSDIDKLIKFIADKQLTNTNIVFVTDDDNFNISSLQNNNFYNTNITSNRFSIIKIGNNIKHYKSEIQSLLSQTNGNIYEINSQEEITQTVEKIFSDTKTHIYKTCDVQEDEELIISDNWKKIQAGYISQRILESMENPQDLQNTLAEEYTIVNQFNSYIALETRSQQNDLDRYSQGEGKYDVKFDTGLSSGGINNGRARAQFTFGSVDKMIIGETVNTNSIHMFGASPKSYNHYNDRKSIEVSFFGFLLMLMYMAQIIGMISFFIKLFTRKK